MILNSDKTAEISWKVTGEIRVYNPYGRNHITCLHTCQGTHKKTPYKFSRKCKEINGPLYNKINDGINGKQTKFRWFCSQIKQIREPKNLSKSIGPLKKKKNFDKKLEAIKFFRNFANKFIWCKTMASEKAIDTTSIINYETEFEGFKLKSSTKFEKLWDVEKVDFVQRQIWAEKYRRNRKQKSSVASLYSDKTQICVCRRLKPTHKNS